MSTGGWCVDDVGRLVALVGRLDHRSESARASGGEGGGGEGGEGGVCCPSPEPMTSSWPVNLPVRPEARP
jgi:hypothetical protein